MYTYNDMRILLKLNNPDWSSEEIDSWDDNQLVAIFLRKKNDMFGFVPNQLVFTKREAKAVEDSITSAESLANDYGDAEQYYTWEELLERYPELDGASQDYLKNFLLKHKYRILEDDFVVLSKKPKF